MCRPVPVCRNLQTSKRCAFCRAYVAATLNFAQEQSWKARLRGRIYCVFSLALPMYLNDAFKAFLSECPSSQNLFSSCSIGRFQHPGSLYAIVYPCLCSNTVAIALAWRWFLALRSRFCQPFSRHLLTQDAESSLYPTRMYMHRNTSFSCTADAWYSSICSWHVLKNSMSCPLGAHWIMLNPIERSLMIQLSKADDI